MNDSQLTPNGSERKVSVSTASAIETGAKLSAATSKLAEKVITDVDGQPVLRIAKPITEKQIKWAMGMADTITEAMDVRASMPDVTKAASLLLGSLKMSGGTSEPEQAIRGFKLALGDVSRVALFEGCRRIISGDASYKDAGNVTQIPSTKFMPTPAEVKLVADQIETRLRNDARQMLRLLSLPAMNGPQKPTPQSEAMKARVQDLAASFQKRRAEAKANAMLEAEGSEKTFEEKMADHRAQSAALFVGGYAASESLLKTLPSTPPQPTPAQEVKG